jgi:hypothetical protein
MNDDEHDEPQRKTVGRPFEPGDGRINRHGAPAFHAFRKQALEIANEKIIGPDGKEITRGEALLRSWLKSRQPKLQELFAFYAWGKPADRLELDALEPPKKIRLVLRYEHEDPDSPNYRPPRTSAKDSWLKRHEEPATVVPSLPLPPHGDGASYRLKGP